eukprot:gnl/TRDRNA2_/TRDRNA2_83619_c0_seq2.p1 gnl/TRDRNA2_/TRDRNA2_83619_c0~~gnl/TRDRNA2_/TRDRNA2_83619_c0_seq2.p1  ORF type:complete len:175 (+),score=18.03 gnl/TRDRNA2_/TRDRNA2_83619_c0_seq2:145-669(+)
MLHLHLLFVGGCLAGTGAHGRKFSNVCRRRQRLRPRFELLAERLGRVARCAAVDARRNEKLKDEWFIDRVPMLMLITDGMVYQYSGKQSVDAMEQWVREDWRASSGEPTPRLRGPMGFWERAWRRRWYHFFTKAVPIIAVCVMASCCLLCGRCRCCGICRGGLLCRRVRPLKND